MSQNETHPVYDEINGLLNYFKSINNKGLTNDNHFLEKWIKVIEYLKLLLDNLNSEMLVNSKKLDSIFNEIINLNQIIPKEQDSINLKNLIVPITESIFKLSEFFPFLSSIQNNNEIMKIGKKSDEYCEILEKDLQKFEAFSNSNQDRIREISGKAETEINKIGEEVKKISNNVKQLSGIVVSDKIAEHFNNKAKSENSFASWWRVGSIASILCAILLVFCYWIFNWNRIFPSFNLSFSQILFPLPLTILFVFLSIYCGQISSKHRIYAKQLEWFYFEQLTLPGYIGDLEKETQIEIKTQLSNKFFGNFSGIEQSKDNPSDLKLIQELLLELVKKR